MNVVLWIGFFFVSLWIVRLVKKQHEKGRETYEVKPHTISPAVYLSGAETNGPTDNYKGLIDWEVDLTTVWAGEFNIEFTYEKRDSSRSRRKVKLLEVCIDRKSRVYLKGFDHGRDDKRTFNIDNITTKILVKSKRYDVDDFLEEFLGLDISLMELISQDRKKLPDREL